MNINTFTQIMAAEMKKQLPANTYVILICGTPNVVNGANIAAEGFTRVQDVADVLGQIKQQVEKQTPSPPKSV